MDTGMPNILWYCTDQQRFDTIASLGNSHIHTPRLDRFRQESVTFTHAFCQSPICTPSRASFLSGMYPSAISVNGNGNSDFPRYYEDRLITHVLSGKGYDCGLVGKLHLASPAFGQENRVADGYRYFEYSHDHKGPQEFGNNYAEWLRRQGADAEKLLPDRDVQSVEAYRRGATMKGFGGLYVPTPDQDNIPPHLHQTFWCTEKAIEFIELNRHSGQPWMLSVNPFDPHAPFDPPWDYYRRYDPATLPGAHFEPGDLAHQQKLVDAGVDFQSKPQHPDMWGHKEIQAAYFAMIEQIDTEFGRLLDYLEAKGIRENTIVIFTSDHGEMLCDHGLLLKGCRLYEGLVRVPLMISWPARFLQDLTSHALVELVDLVPTLYEAVGIEIPYYVQGQSLLPLLKGEAVPTQHRSLVRTEFYGAINYPDRTHATMIRNNKWKLISFHRKNVCELYDLENDPWEHHDLSEHPDYKEIKWELLRQSFDETVYAHPPTSPPVYPF